MKKAPKVILQRRNFSLIDEKPELPSALGRNRRHSTISGAGPKSNAQQERITLPKSLQPQPPFEQSKERSSLVKSLQPHPPFELSKERDTFQPQPPFEQMKSDLQQTLKLQMEEKQNVPLHELRNTLRKEIKADQDNRKNNKPSWLPLWRKTVNGKIIKFLEHDVDSSYKKKKELEDKRREYMLTRERNSQLKCIQNLEEFTRKIEEETQEEASRCPFTFTLKEPDLKTKTAEEQMKYGVLKDWVAVTARRDKIFRNTNPDDPDSVEALKRCRYLRLTKGYEKSASNTPSSHSCSSEANHAEKKTLGSDKQISERSGAERPKRKLDPGLPVTRPKTSFRTLTKAYMALRGLQPSGKDYHGDFKDRQLTTNEIAHSLSPKKFSLRVDNKKV